jgi:glycerol-3-phosphate acyltransferase PlsY
MYPLLSILFGYFLGSIPFAYLLTRRRGIDIRAVGSGNVGATNVLRTTGLLPALTVMALDVGKGAGSVLLAARWISADPSAPAVAGLAAIVGHIYPVWLRFRGGKGVATAAGVFGVLTPLALVPAIVIFIVTTWMTRFVSLGSVPGTVALSPIAYSLHAPAAAVATSAGAAAVIVFRHRANIRRVVRGTERRIGQRVES